MAAQFLARTTLMAKCIVSIGTIGILSAPLRGGISLEPNLGKAHWKKVRFGRWTYPPDPEIADGRRALFFTMTPLISSSRRRLKSPEGTSSLREPIGRAGCLAAGCCWGRETHLPWAITFRNPDAQDMSGTPLFQPLHPAQLYESFADLIIFVFLYRRARKSQSPGEVFAWYLILY